MLNYLLVRKNIKMQDLYIQIKGRVPDVPFSVFWLLTLLSRKVFIGGRLSTWAHMYESKSKSAKFVKRIQMHIEYHSIYMNITLIHINLMIVRYAYVSGSFSQCKIVYLAHMYELETDSTNFVFRIQLYFEYNPL